MRRPSPADPPPNVIQAALRKTTERLAVELGSPTDGAPDWSDFEWRIARAVAAIHGVSPLLSLKLRWQGPLGWREFLEAQRVHTANRQRRIEELLRLVDERARDTGVALVALKGAALHASRLYAAGERPMADVDLLLARPQDLPRTQRIFESLGFPEVNSTWKHRIFEPQGHHTCSDLGEHAANGLKIELHERIAEILPQRRWDLTEIVLPVQPRPGLNAYPSNAALMAHLVLHAAGAVAYRAMRLLHLNDLARLSARMTAADWEEFLGQGAGTRGQWWAFPLLRLMSRYYSSAVPANVLTALAGDCPWLLRRVMRNRTLSDVSLSYLWIDAFPGICWAQSPAEMLRYVTRRIVPNRETLEQRKVLADTDVAAQHSQWARLSQSRRIMRWVRSRPTRAETMHPVRMALVRAKNCQQSAG